MPEWHDNEVDPPTSLKSRASAVTNANMNKPSVLDYTDGIGKGDAEPTLSDMAKYWLDGPRLFQCPYNSCRKKFRNANAILQHMTSTTHARKVFRLVVLYLFCVCMR